MTITGRRKDRRQKCEAGGKTNHDFGEGHEGRNKEAGIDYGDDTGHG